MFHEPSFDTISAAGPNGAMCHYNHLNGTPASLEMDSVYLLDSGGQYTDGTTDITRTVAIGDPGQEVRRLYREAGMKRTGIFSMAGHLDGIVSFGVSAGEAGSILLRTLAAAIAARREHELQTKPKQEKPGHGQR